MSTGWTTAKVAAVDESHGRSISVFRDKQLPPAPIDMPIRLVVTGHVPGIKNSVAPWFTKTGKVRISRGKQKNREKTALVQQLQIFWKYAPCERAALSFVFYVPNGRADMDNARTCLQDAMVKAGVLVNDTMARIAEVSERAVIGCAFHEERTEIIITPLAPLPKAKRKRSAAGVKSKGRSR